MSTENTKISELGLSLHSYYLLDSISEDINDLEKNWNKCIKPILPQEIQVHLEWKKIKDRLDQEYIEILPLEYGQYFFTNENYEVLYKPVILGDTCGILIDTYLDGESLAINSVTKLKKYIETQPHKKKDIHFLGETWFLYGILPDDNSLAEDVAKECYKCWLGDQYKEKIWKDNYQNSQSTIKSNDSNDFWVFELWQQQDENQVKQHHIVIILYKNLDALDIATNNLRESWFRLFNYRHKIIKAYQQSRDVYQELKNKYFPQIYKMIGTVRKKGAEMELIDLADTLQKAPSLVEEYSLKLSTFDYQKRAIEINLNNYKKRLKTMQEKANSGDLEGLEKFGNYATEKYLEQVKWDAENLSPGNTLLHGLIDSISTVRSIIEIKRAESDRRFQRNVSIWGITLAIGAIVASLSAQFPTVIVPVVIVKDATPPPGNLAEQHPSDWLSVVFSLIIVLCAMLICLGIGCLCSYFQSKKTK
jgi:hypothetical protein